jgi:hypothetical protein
VVARLLGLRVRIPPGAWMLVFCVASKDKKQNAGQSTQTNKQTNKQTSMDEVQSTRE